MHSNPIFGQISTGFSTEFLTNEIVMWGRNRGIIQNSTSFAQASKTAEEVEELKEHVAQLKFLREVVRPKLNSIADDDMARELDFAATIDEMEAELLSKMVDDYGDIFVTILMGAEIEGIDLRSCIASAFNEIKDRKGEMRADGKFYKELSGPF